MGKPYLSAILVGVLGAGIAMWAVPAELLNNKAPKITVKEWVTPDPPNVDVLQGQVYVVEFWATWCGPCMATIPHVIEIQKKFKDRGLLVMGLAQKDTVDKVKACIQSKGMNYAVAMDDDTGSRYGVTGIPHASVVNHEGVVVWDGHPGGEGMEAAIEKALDAAPPPLLAGVDLGVFSALKKPLSGGKDFAGAYRSVAAKIGGSDAALGTVARAIVETVDKRIKGKMDEAQALREKEPYEAYRIFSRLVECYGGIDLVKPAQDACRELSARKEIRDEASAEKALKQVERALQGLRTCPEHTSFRAGCAGCLGKNRQTFPQIVSELGGIVRNYGATAAGGRAKELYDSLKAEATGGK
ncbi:MAG: redoxin family protein [Planctomycetota bacterium]